MITCTPTLRKFDDLAIKYHKSKMISILLGIGVLMAYPIIWHEDHKAKKVTSEDNQ